MTEVKTKTIIKILFVVFLLSFSIVILSFYPSWSNKIDCKLKGGYLVWISGYDVSECVMKTNDYKKICSSNSDCEGICIIDDNWKESGEFCKGEIREMDIDEFEKRINAKIKGHCSEFNIRCCGEYGYFNVENNIISCTESEWGKKYVCFDE